MPCLKVKSHIITNENKLMSSFLWLQKLTIHYYNDLKKVCSNKQIKPYSASHCLKDRNEQLRDRIISFHNFFCHLTFLSWKEKKKSTGT